MVGCLQFGEADIIIVIIVIYLPMLMFGGDVCVLLNDLIRKRVKIRFPCASANLLMICQLLRAIIKIYGND